MECLVGNNRIIIRDRHFISHRNSLFVFLITRTRIFRNTFIEKIIRAVTFCPGTCIVSMALSINRQR